MIWRIYLWILFIIIENELDIFNAKILCLLSEMGIVTYDKFIMSVTYCLYTKTMVDGVLLLVWGPYIVQ